MKIIPLQGLLLCIFTLIDYKPELSTTINNNSN